MVNGTVTNYGHFEIGVVPPYNGATDLGTYDYNVTNTGWVHVVVPLNPVQNQNLQNITGFFLKQYGGFCGPLNGTTTLWIDNLTMTFTNLPRRSRRQRWGFKKQNRRCAFTLEIPATFTPAKKSPRPARTNHGSAGTGYPVSYSINLLSYPSAIAQTHIFLLPVNSRRVATRPGATGVDYSYASNAVWLSLNPGPSAGTVIANVLWKTNHANANPDQTALTSPTRAFWGRGRCNSTTPATVW